MASKIVSLSSVARDPRLVRFFKRGEQDGAAGAEVCPRRPRDLDGGKSRPMGFVPNPECERDLDAFGILSAHLGRGDRFAARVLEDA